MKKHDLKWGPRTGTERYEYRPRQYWIDCNDDDRRSLWDLVNTMIDRKLREVPPKGGQRVAEGPRVAQIPESEMHELLVSLSWFEASAYHDKNVLKLLSKWYPGVDFEPILTILREG